MSLPIYIGWDSTEEAAYEVCKHSLLAHASEDLEITPIKQHLLREYDLFWRGLDPLASTEFSMTRFMTPYLSGYKGWSLFMDCDFMWRNDVVKVFDYADPKYAVLVVKHDYRPKELIKMNGALQTQYPRKNWSSLMLINCGHPSVIESLGLQTVNEAPPADLHRFRWAKDGEIGELPLTFNYLEGWHTKEDCPDPVAVHFTRGGPWLSAYKNVEYADEWNLINAEVLSNG